MPKFLLPEASSKLEKFSYVRQAAQWVADNYKDAKKGHDAYEKVIREELPHSLADTGTGCFGINIDENGIPESVYYQGFS